MLKALVVNFKVINKETLKPLYSLNGVFPIYQKELKMWSSKVPIEMDGQLKNHHVKYVDLLSKPITLYSDRGTVILIAPEMKKSEIRKMFRVKRLICF